MQLSAIIVAIILSITALAAPVPPPAGPDVVAHGVAHVAAHRRHGNRHIHHHHAAIEPAHPDGESHEQHLEARGGDKLKKAVEKVKAAGSNTKAKAGNAAGPLYRAVNEAVRQAKGKEPRPTTKKTKTRVDGFADR